MSANTSGSAMATFLASFSENEQAGGGSPLSSASTDSPSSGNTASLQGAAVASASASATLPRDERRYPHCPVYIPSLGRADQERGTIALLVKDLVPFTVVVEPEEVSAYEQLINHNVFLNFGDASMVFSQGEHTSEGNAKGHMRLETMKREKQEEDEEETSRGFNAGSQLCVCCVHEGRETKGPHAGSDALLPRRHQLAQLYHHGYAIPLPSSTPTSSTKAGTSSANIRYESDGELAVSPEFMLGSVDEVRALFRVAALPESGQGVSYVRNYILQVLVPQDMVAVGVDRTGHVEELELFGPDPSLGNSNSGEPSAALSSASSLPSMLAAKAYLQSAQLRSLHISAAADGSTELAAATAAAPSQLSLGEDTPEVIAALAPHILYGYYWVMDDDISSFFHALADSGEEAKGLSQQQRKNVRVSAREIMRQVAARVEILHRRHKEFVCGNSNPSSRTVATAPIQRPLSSFVPHGGGGYATRMAGGTFTCKEDCLANNPLQNKRTSGRNGDGGSNGGNGGGGSSSSVAAPLTQLNTSNFTHLPRTACIALEYSRFAYTYDDTALAVNSYANIACLFNYSLLHSPKVMHYFPPNVSLVGVRSVSDVLGSGIALSNASLNPPAAGEEPEADGDNAALTNRGTNTGMLWYRFTVREDYDFSLQLIARGMCTLRFRNLSFDVPQMAKLRGGMTGFYKARAEHIPRQNALFVRQWPAVAMPWVKGRNSTEREDIKVAWGALLPGRSRHPGAFLFLSEPLPQIREQATIQKLTMQREHEQRELVDEKEKSKRAGSAAALSTAGIKRSRPEEQQSVSGGHTPARKVSKSGVTWKGKRHWGSETDETDETTSDTVSSNDGSKGDDGLAATAPPPPSLPAFRPPPGLVPLQVSPTEAERDVAAAAHTRKSGWKGYAVERWRDVSTAEAARMGLHAMPLAEQRVGSTVAVIPPSFAHNPSCVLATLLERQTNSTTGTMEWTAAAQRARGIPLLSVPPERVYKPPANGVAEVAAAVDYFFSGKPVDASATAPTSAESPSAGGGNGSGQAAWLDD